MWLLILIAVHVNNPKDIPGKVELRFDNKEACEKSLSSLTFQLKTRLYKIEGKCEHY